MIDLDLIEVAKNYLLCVQHKDRSGVCIIPGKQLKAAKKLLKKHGKKFIDCEGSKRTNELRFYFDPPCASEEDAEHIYEDAQNAG